MTFRLSPSDEDKVIRMILRDAVRAIKRRKPDADFTKAKAKLQKIVFLVAEKLDIPITRSWYLYGGYVHYNLLDIEDIAGLEYDMTAASQYLFGEGLLALGEQVSPELFGISPQKYLRAVEKIAPEVYFSRLEEFLKDFYKGAPESYCELYLYNTRLNNALKDLKERASQSSVGLEDFIKCTEKPSTAICKKIAPVVSSLLAGFAKNSLDEPYYWLYRFSEVFERYIVKLGYGREGLSKLDYIHGFYKDCIWKVAALRFSIDTVKGVRAEEVRNAQQSKLNSLLKSLPSMLEALEKELESQGLLASFKEMAKFYEAEYGGGAELAQALIGAMWGNG